MTNHGKEKQKQFQQETAACRAATAQPREERSDALGHGAHIQQAS